MIMMMKKQPWMMFKQVFSMINSSSFNNVLPLRPLCSSTTNTITVSNNKQQQQQLNILLEKKHPLLVVPYNHVTPTKYLLRQPYKRLSGEYGSYTCDGNLGFINLFHGDDDDDDQLKKEEEEEEVEVEIYNAYLPEIEERRICGSSEGWLVTVHNNGEFQLLNPVTRDLVHLPPWTQFPLSDYNKHVYTRDSFIHKVVTYTTTTTNSTTMQPVAPGAATVVVMAIYDLYGGLAFCRTAVSSSSSSSTTTVEEVGKTTSWITMPTKTPISLEYPSFIAENDITHEVIDGVTYRVYMFSWWVDVTFYKGNFYAVDFSGRVGVVKGLDGPSPFVQTLINEPDQPKPEYRAQLNYLVESFSSSSSSSGGGDLLMVVRSIKEDEKIFRMLVRQIQGKETEEEEEDDFFDLPYRTIGFNVWKLDLNGAASASWGEGEITNLGEDCALFVGYNHSFSFSASKIPGCKGNCIYFTDNDKARIFCYPEGGHDIGVYNLEDGSFGELNYETICSISQLFMPPPVWYVPS